MAIDAGSQILFVPAAAAAVTGQVTTSTGVKFEIPILEDFDVYEIGFLVTVATDADTLAITFRDRPTPGSASGQVSIGVLTGPTAAIIAAGTVLRKQIGNYRVAKGNGVAIDVTDATGAGSGFFYLKGSNAGGSTVTAGDLASTT